MEGKLTFDLAPQGGRWRGRGAKLRGHRGGLAGELAARGQHTQVTNSLQGSTGRQQGGQGLSWPLGPLPSPLPEAGSAFPWVGLAPSIMAAEAWPREHGRVAAQQGQQVFTRPLWMAGRAIAASGHGKDTGLRLSLISGCQACDWPSPASSPENSLLFEPGPRGLCWRAPRSPPHPPRCPPR